MKKYIFIILMGFSALNARCQKLEKPDIDKITGDTTFTTKEQVLSNPFGLVAHGIAGYVIKNKVFCALAFHLIDGFDVPYYVNRGDVAIIKFSDGTLLEIQSTSYVNSTLITDIKPQITQSDIWYDLTADDIAILKTGKIAVIRIMTSTGPSDYEINTKKSEVIKKQLELIAKQ